MSEETKQQRQRRLNRERQARYRKVHAEKIRKEQRDRYRAKKALEELGLL